MRLEFFFILSISISSLPLNAMEMITKEIKSDVGIEEDVSPGHQWFIIDDLGVSQSFNPEIAPRQSVLMYNRENFMNESVVMRAQKGVDGRKKISPTTAYPFRCFAHLKIALNGGQSGGSGVLIGPHHMLTAGHCVYDLKTKQWAKNITVYCGLDDQVAPFGKSRCIRIYAPESYIINSDTDFDIALIILDRPIGLEIGWLGCMFTKGRSVFQKNEVSVTGYPGDKGFKQMWSMTHTVRGLRQEKIVYDIDTIGGQSGGPIWSYFQNQTGEHPLVLGIHTHGESVVGRGNSGVRLSEQKFLSFMAKIRETSRLILKKVRDGGLCATEHLIEIGDAYAKLETGSDTLKALNCYTKATRQYENLVVQALGYIRLGDLYYFGEKVSLDYKKALKCYETASKQGSHEEVFIYGMRRLGDMYFEGLGTEQDFVLAAKCYSLVIGKNTKGIDDGVARCMLGYMCYEGLGGKQDKNGGYDHLRMVLSQNQFSPVLASIRSFSKSSEEKGVLAIPRMLEIATEAIKAAAPSTLTFDHVSSLPDERKRNEAIVDKIFLSFGPLPASESVREEDDGSEAISGFRAFSVKSPDRPNSTVKLLLEKGADCTSVDESGLTALHFAAMSGNIEGVVLLLKRGAPVDAREKTRFLTPLHFAVKKNYVNVVGTLLKGGANRYAVNQEGWSVIHIAAESGYTDMVGFLLDLEFEVDFRTNSGLTALHAASAKGNTRVVELLLAKGADVHAKTRTDNSTALHYAAESVSEETVRYLLANGSSVQAVDSDGLTPYHRAVKKGHLVIVKLLIEAGAKIRALDGTGKNALHMAVEAGASDILAFLIDEGLDCNDKSRAGWTPLHYASNVGNESAVNLLLAKRADINTKTEHTGETALDLALRKNYSSKIIRMLRESGADRSGKEKMRIVGEKLKEWWEKESDTDYDPYDCDPLAGVDYEVFDNA